jgi:hypothetical protein
MPYLPAFLAILLLATPPPDPAPASLLAGIRQKMRENLARLPDYTCQLNIERSTRAAGSRRTHAIDTVHIEVGYVDGKELYAWPGQKFEGQTLEEMVPAGGAVGTGDFALHVKSIFLSDAASFVYIGRGTGEDGETVGFRYQVTRAKSRYLLGSGKQLEVVGYHGTFWADARTLLLIRLEIEIDGIDPKLQLKRAGSTLRYGMAKIGEREFLLPSSSELYMVRTDDSESRNMTRFEQCRQYLGESVMSFAEPEVTAKGPKAISAMELPGGLAIDVILQTTLAGERLAIGDPFLGVVSHAVMKSGTTLVPKGARVTGRVTRLGHTVMGRLSYQVAGIRLVSIEFADRRVDFRGSLESVGLAAAQITVAGERGFGDSKGGGHRLEPGEGVFFFKGIALRIPAGAHMVWRTTASGK